MSDGKKYYWLKLQNNFFDSLRIKKMRRMAGGDTYTIIYLKMQLKSLSSDGVLTYTGIEEDFASEVALDIDESVDNVKVVIGYLLSCGLLQQMNENYYSLPFVIENTGSEVSSTQRSRECRERKKALQCNAQLLQCNTNATQVQQECNEVQQNCNIEIEIEKEIEKDIEIDKDKNKAKPLELLGENVKPFFKDYIKMRKSIKRPLTDRGIERLVLKLLSMSNVEVEQIEILKKCTDRCWLDFYQDKKTNEKDQVQQGSFDLNEFVESATRKAIR